MAYIFTVSLGCRKLKMKLTVLGLWIKPTKELRVLRPKVFKSLNYVQKNQNILKYIFQRLKYSFENLHGALDYFKNYWFETR